MKRNLFTEEEIILCTYAAMYDANDFGGTNEICKVYSRKKTSIDMKIRNIATMLDEKGILRYNKKISPLTGLPPGEEGRTTNWDIVMELYPLDKAEFLNKCKMVIKNTKKT